MRSNGDQRRRFGSALAIGVVLAGLLSAACSATPDAESLGESKLLQQNTTPQTCDDKFECDCEAIGGTVDGPNWCCKHDADGSSTCTNSPDLIISWLETPPGPERPPHVQDIPGLKLELDIRESRAPKPDLSDPVFAAACEDVKRLADGQKLESLEFDPKMSGFPGAQTQKGFDVGACSDFCDVVENACDFVLCAPDDAACWINCMRLGTRCDFFCIDLFLADRGY